MWKLPLEEFLEKRLVARVIAGDRDAGELLVRKHYASIFGFMMSLTQNRDAAEELVQITFVCSWQSLPSFRYKSSLRTWLHSIAYRQYIKWLKVQSRPNCVELPEPRNLESGVVDAVWVKQAMAAMPPLLAEPFTLFYLQQMQANEIAEILDLKLGTVLSRLHSARQLMRKLMTGQAQTSLLPDESEEEDANFERSHYEMSKAPL